MARAPTPLHTAVGVRRLLRVGLGLVWIVAFGSLWVQVDGLYGPEGIHPVGPWMAAVSEALGGDALAIAWRAPTLLWLLPAAWGPWLLCVTGVIAGAVVVSGRWAAPANVVAYLGYRSLMQAGGVFLAYPWDALLLEVGLVATALLPWRRTATRQPPPEAWWALRFVLVKVVFLSGVVKLTSGDPMWSDLSALTVHYETQPLPTVAGWAAHQLPAWIHGLSALALFVIELPLALLILGPRRVRTWGAAGTALLMVLLMITGNYGFFQLLVLVLCLAVLDDDHLVAARLGRLRPSVVPAPASRGARIGAGALLALVVAASLLRGVPRYTPVDLPEPLAPVARTAATLGLGPGYGLFARMTDTRPLPILEARWGDGPWSEVRWAWQTSDPMLAPARMAPHLPRLDWQLWFAGLGTCRGNPWLVATLDRLLAGSDPVEDLVGDPRLRTRPPDALRLVRYRYRMAGPDDQAWWTRERVGPYCPGARTREGWVGFEAPPPAITP